MNLVRSFERLDVEVEPVGCGLCDLFQSLPQEERSDAFQLVDGGQIEQLYQGIPQFVPLPLLEKAGLNWGLKQPNVGGGLGEARRRSHLCKKEKKT